jgi:hypothetical protein
MTAQYVTDWQLWNSLACARIPLQLLIEPYRVSERTQMKDVRSSAYIYRMFDLFFFNLRDPAVVGRLEDKEKMAIQEFTQIFDALPWSPLPTHPHISELPNEDLGMLRSSAKKIDRYLWLRTGRGVLPVVHRLLRGWPLFESSLKAKERANKAPEPTACSVTPRAIEERLK